MTALPQARDALKRGIDAGLHLGAQLYVVGPDGGRHHLALGQRRPGRPMEPDTLMLWLSATKPVTAVAVAQQWERGRLRLDDRVAEHLPAFAAGGKEAITLRHLLTHTGGFRVLRFGWPDSTWEEILSNLFAARKEPRWAPGLRAGYHQASSWFVLGELVRHLDGRPFPEYVRQEIFEPLGMFDSWIGMPRARYRTYGDRLVQMFDTEARPPTPHPWDREAMVTGCSPGGNGWGPMRELGRFYEMLAGGGTWNGVTLLRPQTVEALLTRHRVGLMDRTFRHRMDWGLGFIPNSAYTGDETLPYHYGRRASTRTFGHAGYRSVTAFCDLEHGVVVALAVNGTPADEAHRRRFEAVLESIYEDLGLAGPPADD